ncbi:MurR/RpiR family transcriptional regulator [Metabacillus malikii]|uniref:DNA-binding MurR/RpiR family transcriptional regulator n=1 Tax=Metabacillus malikii TaxID=1504265 RepID=A0ABT9ZF18_9BACI|nr:MurR/RpiR family transcriptional regulator [Metabacillus malikii]MDQ0230851.1 DNA-binding MurR/RpiR family transcriptional regulator [Metabacillus malikii]
MVELNWNTDTLSPNQFKLADFIQKNIEFVLLSTEQEISNKLDMSIASVSRFWRSVGYKNFKEFKLQVKEQIETSPAGKMENIMRQVEGGELQHHTLSISINHLNKTLQYFSAQEFKQVIHTLTTSKRIFLYCPGPSRGLGELMSYRMSRYGMSIKLIENNGSEILEELLHIQKEDVVVIFGFIRLLPEAKVLLQQSKAVGFKTILLTDQLVSNFTDLADSVLFTSRGELQEFHSMVAPTYMVENIIIATGMENKTMNIKKLEELSDLRKKYSSELPR